MVLTRLTTITAVTSSSTTANYSTTHTTDSGTTLLVVLVSNGAATTAVTFDGAAMTNLGGSSQGSRPRIFYLLSPNIGAGLTIQCTNASNANHAVLAYNFSGNDMTTPMESLQQTDDSDTGTVTVVTSRNDSYCVGLLGTNNTGATVAMSTGTERLDGAGTDFKWTGGEQAAATAGNQTVTFTYSAGGARMVGAGVVPALPVVGPANLKTYNTNVKANIKTINTNPIANVKSLDTNV